MKKSSYLYELNLPEKMADLRGQVPDEMSAEAVRARFLAARAELPREVTVIDPLAVSDFPASLENEVFVAEDGSDSADGSLTSPLRTVAEAARRVAGKGGAVITVRGGRYAFSEPLTLTEAQSGREGAPFILRSYPGEQVTFTGNTPLSTERGKWQLADPATDPVAARLPSAVQGKVYTTRLSDHGLTAEDIPAIRPKQEGPPSLLVNGEAYTLARYPNTAPDPHELLYFVYVYDSGRCTVRDGSDLYWSWIDRCNAEGWDPMKEVGWEIRIVDEKQWELDRPAEYAHKGAAAEITKWVNTGDIWYYGSTFEGWEFGYYNLALETEGQYWAHTADGRRWTPGDGVPYLGTPKAEMLAGQNPTGTSAWGAEAGYSLKSVQSNHWGTKVSGNSPARANTYYLFNAIEALDEPGEWFLDRKTGILYLYPKDEGSFFGSEMSFSSKNAFAPLTLSGLSHAIVEGITVDGTGDVGITLDSCFDLVLQKVKVRNTKKENLLIKDCRRTAVIHSDFSRAGTVLVKFEDANAHYGKKPTFNLLQNNFFHDPSPMRQHAMLFAGCRSVISHNYFRNTCMDSSTASECIIEYNRFEGGNADVVDGGMYYASGYAVRSNHIRYNLFHMFNATHQAMYFDTMCGGNYAYGNIVSTLGSMNKRHKGWYSSTGHGNVCVGNIFILRDPWEIARAKGRDGDEEEIQPGDNINQSGLFFYYFGNEHAAANNRQYRLVAEGREELYPVEYAPEMRGEVLSQSLAGHWWQGMAAGEVKAYLEDRDPAIITANDPAYAAYLRGTAVVLDALDHSDYRVKYFYVPARPTGKTYTSSAAPAGTPIVIPTYSYLDEDYREVEVEAHTVTVGEDGKITLTYEELAAIERIRRAPAYCVIENNLVLGGTPICDPDTKAVIGDADPDYMVNDSLAYYWYQDKDGHYKLRNAHGYRKTAREAHNFLLLDFARVIRDARGFDYTVKEESIPLLSETLESDELSRVLSLRQEKTGPTYGFDYASLGPVQKK